MKFSQPFTDLEKIQLLQRSILVQSYCYYELNQNLLSDYQYDMNTRQLLDLKKSAPGDFRKSKYYKYFDNFESGTGFDLTGRLKKDKKLYKIISHDAHLALKYKEERRGEIY